MMISIVTLTLNLMMTVEQRTYLTGYLKVMGEGEQQSLWVRLKSY